MPYEENEEAEFPHAGANRLAEDLQTLGVARQFEDSKDADEPHHSEDGERHGVAAAAGRPLGVDEHGAERHVVGDDGDQVDDVHEVLEEDDVVRTGGEAQRELGREPDDADRLYDKERFVGLVSFFIIIIIIIIISHN